MRNTFLSRNVILNVILVQNVDGIELLSSLDPSKSLD